MKNSNSSNKSTTQSGSSQKSTSSNQSTSRDQSSPGKAGAGQSQDVVGGSSKDAGRSSTSSDYQRDSEAAADLDQSVSANRGGVNGRQKPASSQISRDSETEDLSDDSIESDDDEDSSFNR